MRTRNAGFGAPPQGTSLPRAFAVSSLPLGCPRCGGWRAEQEAASFARAFGTGSACAASGQCDSLLGCPAVCSLGALGHDSLCRRSCAGRPRPPQCDGALPLLADTGGPPLLASRLPCRWRAHPLCASCSELPSSPPVPGGIPNVGLLGPDLLRRKKARGKQKALRVPPRIQAGSWLAERPALPCTLRGDRCRFVSSRNRKRGGTWKEPPNSRQSADGGAGSARASLPSTTTGWACNCPTTNPILNGQLRTGVKHSMPAFITCLPHSHSPTVHSLSSVRVFGCGPAAVRQAVLRGVGAHA